MKLITVVRVFPVLKIGARVLGEKKGGMISKEILAF